MMDSALAQYGPCACHTRPHTRPQSFALTTLLLTPRLDLALCQTMQRGAIFVMLAKESQEMTIHRTGMT